MNTFNLGLVFGQAEEVIIIVCASENPLDGQELNQIATKHFKAATLTSQNIPSIIQKVVKGLKSECSCNVVTVTADAACMIHRR